jgi:HAD superfamily hydrolase (TIGR01549 family)
MLNTFLFDLDGTIWDSKPAIIKTLKKVIGEKNGQNLSEKSLLDQIDKITPIKILNNHGISLDVFWNEYAKNYSLVKLFFADTDSILADALDRKKKLGVVTSLKKTVAMTMLENFGLTDFFSTIVTPSDTTARKPSPQPVLIAIDRLKSDIRETIYLGDQEIDIVAAKSAGCYSALALWGNNSKNTIAPDFELSKLRDILHLSER